MEQVEQIYRNNYSIYNIMFYIVYYGLIGKRYFGPRRRCVSYMEFAPLAPPLYFGIQTIPRSCRRSSTLRSESGNRTYNITVRRMISGLVLKYLNGECFVICGFYKYTLLASTEFNLTVPTKGFGGSGIEHPADRQHALNIRPPAPETLLEKPKINGRI